MEKLLTIFKMSLEGAVQAHLFSNSIATYALTLGAFPTFVALKSPKENVRKVATFTTFVTGLTSLLASFTSFVYTFQIHDFNY